MGAGNAVPGRLVESKFLIFPFIRSCSGEFVYLGNCSVLRQCALHFDPRSVAMRTGTPSWQTVKLMAFGAVSFWLPDTIWHAIRGYRFNSTDVIAISILLPLTLLGMYLFIKSRPANEPRAHVGLPLMLGVWLLGGFFIAVGASFEGGGFVGGNGFRGGVVMTLIGLVPPGTYMMAAYDGSLGALVLATLAAILIAVSGRRREKRRQQSGSFS